MQTTAWAGGNRELKAASQIRHTGMVLFLEITGFLHHVLNRTVEQLDPRDHVVQHFTVKGT